MKNFILSLTLILTLTISLAPKRADAIVGLATGAAPVAVTGLVIALGGRLMIYSAANGHMDEFSSLAYALIGLYGIFVGTVVLDENNLSVEFSKVNPETTSKLGLSSDEVEIFNSEIDELNLMANEISSRAKTVNEAASLWDEVRVDFSPETFSVLKAITSK
jgi:predicted tellurium resistance membrane protein TerC